MRLRALAILGVAAAAGIAWVGLRDFARPGPATTGAGVEAKDARRFWSLYRRAGEARTEGRFDDAAALYAQALELRPEHEDSLYYLGNCLLERREYDGAVAAYQRLVTVNPLGSSRGYMQLGSIRASLDERAPVDLVEARVFFQRALELDPDSGALLGLAEVAILERRLPDAERLLANVEADNPMSIAAPYLRGYLAFERGDLDGAWALFSTAVARGELKKPVVKWTEEGDVKASPELRWRALARQSVFGPDWIRLRAFLAAPGAARADMRREYERLHRRMARRWE